MNTEGKKIMLQRSVCRQQKCWLEQNSSRTFQAKLVLILKGEKNT